MSDQLEIITGGSHTDGRGIIAFVNDFDMSPVKRMYMISHSDTEVRRGWRGHQIERRWFYVVEGSFEIKLVKIDDWTTPDPDAELKTIILSADDPQVIYVPAGYATCIKAQVINSKLMVYGDTLIAEAVKDDHLYPADYFNNWN